MGNEIDNLIYQIENGDTKIDVRLESETVWMTQKVIAEFFQSTKQNISHHIKNIFNEKELDEDKVVKHYLTTSKDGKSYNTKHYNLEMIVAIGYRVRTHRGTQLRQWATKRLNEYLVKGFTMDNDSAKEMRNLGQDYFEELLERIHDIRASDRRFYQKITDIYATAVDYDGKAAMSKGFFVTVQNKLHFAIHGHTVFELIAKRADASKENMGLTSWKGEKVRKQDIMVAKNYLTEQEIKQFNRIVTMYLDYAEVQAERNQPMYMQDWIKKLNAFLQFNDREILQNAGKVSAKVAEQLALQEYEKFNQSRLLKNVNNTDFDEFIKKNRLK